MNIDDVFRVFGEVLFCDFLSSFPIPFILVRMSFVHKYKLTEKKIYWKRCFDSVKSFDKLWYKNKPTLDLGGKRSASLTHPPLLTSCVILSNICGSNQPFFLSSQARGPMNFPWNLSPPSELQSFLLAAPPSSQCPQTENLRMHLLLSHQLHSLSNPHLQSIAPSCQ